mmetsp:Transcript_81767/g.227710  ORF Transcript_81767/g.227710 Transcript_81767/m.227710 type:complete len:458 (-) Transcript_81767:35-1408(-)
MQLTRDAHKVGACCRHKLAPTSSGPTSSGSASLVVQAVQIIQVVVTTKEELLIHRNHHAVNLGLLRRTGRCGQCRRAGHAARAASSSCRRRRSGHRGRSCRCRSLACALTPTRWCRGRGWGRRGSGRRRCARVGCRAVGRVLGAAATSTAGYDNTRVSTACGGRVIVGWARTGAGTSSACATCAACATSGRIVAPAFTVTVTLALVLAVSFEFVLVVDQRGQIVHEQARVEVEEGSATQCSQALLQLLALGLLLLPQDTSFFPRRERLFSNWRQTRRRQRSSLFLDLFLQGEHLLRLLGPLGRRSGCRRRHGRRAALVFCHRSHQHGQLAVGLGLVCLGLAGFRALLLLSHNFALPATIILHRVLDGRDVLLDGLALLLVLEAKSLVLDHFLLPLLLGLLATRGLLGRHLAPARARPDPARDCGAWRSAVLARERGHSQPLRLRPSPAPARSPRLHR